MPRYKGDINNIYISERMQECLRRIEEYRLTTIVAPMGYGKTTAALWYLNNRQEHGDRVYRINIYSEDVNMFWQNFCRVFAQTEFGKKLSGMEFPSGKTATAFFVQMAVSYIEMTEEQIYILLDDCHLMTDKRVLEIVLALCKAANNRLHIIMSSRSTVLLEGEEFSIGNRLHQITSENMKLNPAELSVYCRRCGVNLTDAEVNELFRTSEGWFSCVYLNLRNVMDHGTLLHERDNIYTMIGESLFAHHEKETQEFMLAMCMADEFTLEQADYIVGQNCTKELIRGLLQENAFIRYLSDSDTFRFHHLLREYVGKQFAQLPMEKQKHYHTQYGKWYESQKQYIRAIFHYESAGDMRALLRVIGLDCGVQIASAAPDKIVVLLNKCTEQEMMAEPQAMLVLMRRLFSWRQIPKMLELKGILLKAASQSELTEEERNNLKGECDLIMSFLGYNDIAAMSRLHQSACQLMTRPAISIEKNGSYTFGSPSVLMMFHREAGQLDSEIATMNKAMPYYYKVADDQGKGAEQLMEAEALFCRGKLSDARIMAEKAKVAANEKQQNYIELNCEFLKQRIALFETEKYDPNWYQKKQKELGQKNDPTLLNALDSCAAYLYTLTGRVQEIPEWFLQGELGEVNLLGPARPMYELIYNQVLLEQSEYIKVLGREEKLLQMFRAFPYLLCEIYLHIQLAVAKDRLGKTEQAISELTQAFELALPDGILIPFVENAERLDSLFKQMPSRYMEEIEKQSLPVFMRVQSEVCFEQLTEKEAAVARLSILGKTRKEIAKELYLSENTVRNYLSRIYEKLEITGSPKQKQYILAEKLTKKG